MSQKPVKGAPPTVDVLIRYMADVKSTIGSLEKKVDAIRSDLDKKMDKHMDVVAEADRAHTASLATLGNQVSYFRETVCTTLKDTVSRSSLRSYKYYNR